MGRADKLGDYRKKRDTKRSPEPAGGRARRRRPGSPRFVIQEHDASTLHFDFRLEVDGVLKSWAVPKGPSTDPRVKRLAIQVEDHPLDYADFEGVIPEGEYGAGPVIVWDRGTYRNLRLEKVNDGRSMAEAVEEGFVEVWLEGEKLQGGYVLFRTGRDNQWLLKKIKDEAADARRNPVSTQPRSVASGRTVDQVREEAP
jgi:DNA ligase D-like protein (predicted 3'-phosphoesterase)